MNDAQQQKELKYLRHSLLNGSTNIMGCLKEIEKNIAIMTEAIDKYYQSWNSKGNDSRTQNNSA